MPRRSTCSRKYRSWSWWRRIGRPASASSVLRPTQRADLPGRRVLVGHRHQRHDEADLPGELGAPEPGAHTTMSAAMTPSAVRTPVTRLPFVDDAEHLGVGTQGRPAASARAAWASAARRALASPSAGVWKPPRTRSSSISGCSARHSSGVIRVPSMPQDCAQPALRCRSAQPLGGGGHLEAADRVEHPPVRMREGAELLDGVLGERGHGLGRVGLEHQAGGMRGGPAGGEQRAPVEDGDVGPAARGQFVGQGAADDAGTDDDDSGHAATAPIRLRIVLLRIHNTMRYTQRIIHPRRVWRKADTLRRC